MKANNNLAYWVIKGPEWRSRYSDSLRAGRSGDRILVGGGRDFLKPVQTGPEAHSASCTMGTGSFPGVKQPGRGAYQPCGPQSPVIVRTVLNNQRGCQVIKFYDFCKQKTHLNNLQSNSAGY
jgi:hypothetical protein